MLDKRMDDGNGERTDCEKVKSCCCRDGLRRLVPCRVACAEQSGDSGRYPPEKVDKINKRISPIQDKEIEEYLAERNLDLTATLDGENAYADADVVIIAASTNYDSQKNFFDCSAVEVVIELVLKSSENAVMVIKSTIPVGYTESLRKKYNTDRILFSPEFLRESKALYDNLYPSRIIVGCDEDTSYAAESFPRYWLREPLKGI